MVEKIRAVFERYGFEPVETPAIEYTDALGKFLPDQDRPNEGVFSFQDDDEQWLSLRYDLTAPLARYVAENYQNLALPYRSYRYGYVLSQREAGPGPLPPVHAVRRRHGRRGEHGRRRRDVHAGGGHDGGAGHSSAASYVVKVNNRKVLDGVMESIGSVATMNAGNGSPSCVRSINLIDLGWKASISFLVQDAKTRAAISQKAQGLTKHQIESLSNFCSAETCARLSKMRRSIEVQRVAKDRQFDGSAIWLHARH